MIGSVVWSSHLSLGVVSCHEHVLCTLSLCGIPTICYSWFSVDLAFMFLYFHLSLFQLVHGLHFCHLTLLLAGAMVLRYSVLLCPLASSLHDRACHRARFLVQHLFFIALFSLVIPQDVGCVLSVPPHRLVFCCSLTNVSVDASVNSMVPSTCCDIPCSSCNLTFSQLTLLGYFIYVTLLFT